MILPAFCAAFPDHADYTRTNLHKELSNSRRVVQSKLDVTTTESSIAEIHAAVLGIPSTVTTLPTGTTSHTNPAHSLAEKSLSALNQNKRRLEEIRKEASVKVTSVLRAPLSTLWQQAFTASSNPRETNQFLQYVRLQSHMTRRIELQLYRSLLPTLTPYQQVILTATTMTNGVGNAWLTVLPTEPSYCMTNDSFRLALRHRLGIVPYNCLYGQQCRTMNCTSTSATGEPMSFDFDPDHFHSCSAHRRAHLTVRHNNLVHTLMRLARSVGFYAAHEPNHHQRPSTVSLKNMDDKDSEGPGGWNDHADILLVKHDRRLYIDVSVTRPTTRSTMNSASHAILTTPLYSCRARATEKHTRYDAIAMLNGYQMIPFCLETYGGIASEAMTLLRTLASHAHDSSEFSQRTFLTHSIQCLSVGLQSGNAFVAEAGMQQHLTDDTRRGNFRAAQSRYEEKRKLVGRVRRIGHYHHRHGVDNIEVTQRSLGQHQMNEGTTVVHVKKTTQNTAPVALAASVASVAADPPLPSLRRKIPSKYLSHDPLVIPTSIADLDDIPSVRRCRPRVV